MDKKYIYYREKVGSFWGLYLMGFNSILNIKITLTILLIYFSLNMISNYLITNLIMNKNTNIIIPIMICVFEKFLSKLGKYTLTPYSNEERRLISIKISDWVHNNFNNATNKWKRENPENVQQEAIETIFLTYFGITWNIAQILLDSIDTITFLIISLYTSYIIGIIAIIGNYLLIIIRKKFSKELDELDVKMVDNAKKLRIYNSNQYTSRIDILVNPLFEKHMEFIQYNPVDGITKRVSIWDNRDRLAFKCQVIGELFKSIIILIICIISINDYNLVLWVLLNGSKLFGVMEIIANLDQVKNISISSINPHLKIIDELEFISTFYSADKIIKNIYVQKINWRPVSDIYLESLSPIYIDLTKKGIILLNGHKGCGKSLTMDVLAGLYDGNICENMRINGDYVFDEFRDANLARQRIYIQQLVSDRYRQNRLNTIAMTLEELFPGATYKEIYDYLLHFDMTKKMPMDLQTILGKNERSFSPGELQAMILASQLYKAIKLNIPLLLLDEPERNIDYQTVKNIFDNVISKYEGVIIMITHNDTLKEYLREKIIQTWQFQSEGNHMMFTVQ